MTERKSKNSSRDDIYDKYRRILKMPNLTKEEIDEIRKNLRLICQSICEHIWGKKLY